MEAGITILVNKKGKRKEKMGVPFIRFQIFFKEIVTL